MSENQKSGCAAILANLFGTTAKTQPPPPMEEELPYRLTQAFLSPAEISFFHILQQAIGEHTVICAKVSLGDLFYPKSGDRKANQIYRNKIDRKHVDFLLCDPKTMHPLLGIELDDASHQQAARQERDNFVERVFSAAGLSLFRQPVRHTYNVQELSTALKQQLRLDEPDNTSSATPEAESQTKINDDETEKPINGTALSPISADGVPLCPKCDQPMVLRTVKKSGPHYGKQFWGCQDFPKCRGVRSNE